MDFRKAMAEAVEARTRVVQAGKKYLGLGCVLEFGRGEGLAVGEC